MSSFGKSKWLFKGEISTQRKRPMSDSDHNSCIFFMPKWVAISREKKMILAWFEKPIGPNL